MYGGIGNDILIGMEGYNYLNGGRGNDVIYSKTHPSSFNTQTSPAGRDTLVGGPGVDTFWIGPSVDGPQTITDLEPGEVILYHINTVNLSNECYALGRVTYEEIEAQIGEFTHLETSIMTNGPGIWTPSMVDILIEICNVDTGDCYNP